MAKCPLCGKETLENELFFLFGDENGSEYNICSDCDSLLDLVEENDEKALNTVEQYLSDCTEKKLKEYVKNVVSESKENAVQKQNAITSSKAETTFWISSLKGVYMVIFWLILIAGIIMFFLFIANENVGLAFIALIASIFTAVVVVGFEIVFLDMAKDIHQIRKNIEEKNQK